MNPFIVLPEGCISEIISFTTPADAIRSSIISRGFKSAAESDIVWDKFLPSDHQNIVFRFPEVAILNSVDLLDIRGKIRTRALSSRTNYGAYLVFKVCERRYHGLESTNAMVRFVDQESEYEAEERASTVILAARAPRNLKGRLPEERSDGWLEVEIGKFYNGDDNGDVEARLLDSRPFHAKCGLIVEGVEFRPI